MADRDADARALDPAAAPIDDRLLLELMIPVEAQPPDRDDTGSIERAHVRRRTDHTIIAHRDTWPGSG